MKTSKIADKIISSVYRQYSETGDVSSFAPSWVEKFPDEPKEKVYNAIRMLGRDGLISVLYANNEPLDFALDVSAIADLDSDTMLRRGYELLKEIRALL